MKSPHRSSLGGGRRGTSAPSSTTLLPKEVREQLKNNLWRLWGMFLLGVSLVGVMGIFTYTPSDPSLNTATTEVIHNALGVPGAIFSDVMIQTVGIAALVPFAIVLVWGLRLMVNMPIGWVPLRLLGLFPTLVLCSMALTTAGQVIDVFPLPNGTSGFLGYLLIEKVQHFGEGFGVEFDVRWLGSTVAMVFAGLMLWWVSAMRLGDGKEMVLGIFGLGRKVSSLSKAAQHQEDEARKASRAFPFGLSVRARRDDEELETMPARQRAEPSFAADDFQGRMEPSVLSTGEELAETVSEGEPLAEKEALAVAENDKNPEKREPTESLDEEAVAPVTVPTASVKSAPPPPPKRDYVLPPVDLLLNPTGSALPAEVNEEFLARQARTLEGFFKDFGVNGDIVEVRPGPVVTVFELDPVPGTKTARVIGLSDDIARLTGSTTVRLAVVPGKSTIGVELPNLRRETVNFRDLVSREEFCSPEMILPLAVGKDITGEPCYIDLARLPHLLMAGASGSGKSVTLHTMICSLLYRWTPDDCRLVLIDPKMLELSVYRDIPHLLTPVVTDPAQAVLALKWAVREMEGRYRTMSEMGVRNVASYNARLKDAREKGQTVTRTVQVGFDQEGKPLYEEQALDMTPFPYIVVVVDEMADLMQTAGKDIEASMQRLAQMARAAGIHLVMATQQPSSDILTGTLKANFPARISFQVSGRIDSRTILGEQGAEQLLGNGDMLFLPPGGKTTRVHGALLVDREIDGVVQFLRQQGRPDYVTAVLQEAAQTSVPTLHEMAGDDAGESEQSGEALYQRGIALVAKEQKASITFVQRHLQIGYNRAARLIERMEREGIVSKANHVGKRDVLVPLPVEPEPVPVATEGLWEGEVPQEPVSQPSSRPLPVLRAER